MAKKPNHVLVIDRVRIDRGETHETFERGDSLAGIPAGQLESLVRLGHAVLASELVAEVEAADEAAAEDETLGDNPPAADWRETPLAGLDLSTNTAKALAATELTTVAELIDYGKATGTLTRITGIGTASEAEIQQAITDLADANLAS